MARRRLNRKVAITGSLFFILLVVGAIVVVLYLSKDPEKFIKDAEAAHRAAAEAQDPHLRQQEYERAEKSYRKALGLIEDDADKVKLLLRLSDFYIETEQWPKVQGCWSGIIQIDSANPRARYGRLKYIYIIADGGLRAAWQEVASQVDEFLSVTDPEVLGHKIEEFEPGELREPVVGRTLGVSLQLMRGRALLEMARQGLAVDADRALEQAVEVLDKAREAEQANPAVYFYLAQVEIVRGEIEESRGHFGKRRQEFYDKALGYLQDAVKAADENPDSHINLLQVKQMIALKTGSEQTEALEQEYLAVTKRFADCARSYAALGALYLSKVKNLDKALDAFSQAVELDQGDVSYAIALSDLYYRRFCYQHDNNDLFKAIDIADSALLIPSLQQEQGPRAQQNKLNRIILNDFLARCCVEQVLEPCSSKIAGENEKWLAGAEQAVHRIEQLYGSGESPDVIRCRGLLELARGNENAAVRKLYSVYEQLKSVGIEHQAGSYLRKCYSHLSYTLGRIFRETEETGAAGAFYASALNTGIISTKPEAVLDHAELLLRLRYYSQALSDINLFDGNFGANNRSKMLRMRVLISSRQYEQAQEQLEQVKIDEPNEIKLRIELLQSRARRLRADISRRRLTETAEEDLPEIVGQETVEQPEQKTDESTVKYIDAELRQYEQQLAGLIDKLMLIEPNSVSNSYMAFMLGHYLQEGKIERSRALVEWYLSYHPDDLSALAYKRRLLEPDPVNISDDRLVEIDKQVRLETADPKLRAVQLGVFYRQHGQLAEAKEQFKASLDLDGKGEALTASSRIKLLDESGKIDEGRRMIVRNLFDVAVRTEDWQLCEVLLRAIRQSDLDGCDGNFFGANYAFTRGKYEEALSQVNECLKVRPVFSRGYLLRSKINSVLKEYDAAVEDSQKAASINPSDGPIAKAVALTLYRRHQQIVQNATAEQTVEVRRALERAMAVNSGDMELVGLYAEFISDTEPERALAIRQRLHRISPTASNAVLLGRMALRMAMSTTEPRRKEALLQTAGSALEQALALEPQNKAALNSYASYCRATGQSGRAEKLLAESEDPKLLWRYYYKSGQYDKAKEIARSLYQAAPNDISALKGLLLVAERTYDRQSLQRYSERLISLEDNVENRLFQIQSFLSLGLINEADSKLQSFREKFGQEPRAMLLESQVLMRRGRLEDALELVNRSLEFDRDQALAWQFRGQINALLGKTERAIADLKRSRSLSGNFVTRLTLAKVFLQAGRKEDAIIELKNVMEDPQALLPAAEILEWVYKRSGRKQQLKGLYHQITGAVPKAVAWKLRAGMFFISEGDYRQAEKMYLDALKIAPAEESNYALALDGYLQSLLLQGKLDELFAVSAKYVDGAAACMSYLNMAEARMKLGDRDGAVDYCRNAVGKIGTIESVAASFLQRIRDLIGFEQTFRICKEIADEKPDSLVANLIMFELLRMEGRYNNALVYINKCLEEISDANEPGDKRTYFTAKKTSMLQMAYMRTSDNNYLRQAVDEYESLLSKMPNNTNVLNNLAYMLAEQGAEHKLPKALEYAERAYQGQPNNPDYMDTYSYVLYKNGKYLEAMKLVRSALQQYETRAVTAPADVYEHLGLVSEKLGSKKEALSAYKRALEVGSEALSDKVRERIKAAVERLDLESGK